MGGSDSKAHSLTAEGGFGTLTYKDGTVVYKGYVKDQWHGEGEWHDLYGLGIAANSEMRSIGNGEVLAMAISTKAV